MAVIRAATNEKVFQITAFKGLNQNPDGDTKLKYGEAADMDNFRITRDGNLQRRPGTQTVADLNKSLPIKGLWVGYVSGKEYMLGACDGKLYRFWDSDSGIFSPVEIGEISTDKDVHIFGFSNIVYILDGTEYWKWDGGERIERVEGYRPLVMIAIPPENAAADKRATYENVNRLCGKRRVWLSPDGNGTSFKIPESPDSLDYVKDAGSYDDLPAASYRYDPETATLEFTTAPSQASSSIEVGYDVGEDAEMRAQVTGMQYAELFSGTQDTRVFLYGDGTNRTIYSGMELNGEPSAEYFPDLYEARVGDENTPITAMIRHYSSLACFKTDSAWSMTASATELADGLRIPSFYVTPVNKSIGMEAPGQARLVLNSPYTLFGNDLYEWRNSSYYTSNLTRDERQARRISDRIWATLKTFRAKDCYCYDDNSSQEYYICFDGKALVYNYAADAWSKYSAFPVSCMANIGDELYIGTPGGQIKHLSTEYLGDGWEPIAAYWESGSMAFGQEYMRKYSAMTFVGVKPESMTELNVSVKTDKKVCDSKTISTGVAEFSFGNIDFSQFVFDERRDAQIYREKIKAKKFVFYKLILQSNNPGTRCTVLSADIRVRFTGFTK